VSNINSKYYCFKCGAKATEDTTIKQSKNGNKYGYCKQCKRKTSFVDYYPTLNNTLKHEMAIDKEEAIRLNKSLPQHKDINWKPQPINDTV